MQNPRDNIQDFVTVDIGHEVSLGVGESECPGRAGCQVPHPLAFFGTVRNSSLPLVSNEPDRIFLQRRRREQVLHILKQCRDLLIVLRHFAC